MRLILITLAALCLTGCDREDIERTTVILTGEPAYAFEAVEQESAVASEVAVEPQPAPPVCSNYVWRAIIYDCHGNPIGEIG